MVDARSIPHGADSAGRAVYFLTDYGTSDELAGLLEAVVERESPGTRVVHLTHGIPPFDVRAGALALARSVAFVGRGVVVGVVDPGVGTKRRGVIIEMEPHVEPHYFVGPDNGLLVWAAQSIGAMSEAFVLAPAPGPAATFDGRDVFAPAAARLARGLAPSDLGEPMDPASLVRLPDPVCQVSAAQGGQPGSVVAEVVWIDHFGNLQTAARPDHLDLAGLGNEEVLDVKVARVKGLAEVHPLRVARRVRAFAELEDKELGVLVDANGYLALVAGRSSAAEELGLDCATVVVLGSAGEAGESR